MKKNLVIVGMVLVSLSCKKSEDTTISKAGRALTGSLILLDQYGDMVKHDLPSIRIQTEWDRFTTHYYYSDAQGHYNLDSLPWRGYSSSSDSYGLSFDDTSTHYGAAGTYSQLPDEGTRTVSPVTMSEKPTFQITTLNADDTNIQGQDYIRLRGSVALPDARPRMLAAFYHYSADVSSYINYVDQLAIRVEANTSNYEGLIPVFELKKVIYFPKGSTVYFAVYPAAVRYLSSSTYGPSVYSLNTRVYNALGSSPQKASVIVP